jgi:hypothetical protein
MKQRLGNEAALDSIKALLAFGQRQVGETGIDRTRRCWLDFISTSRQAASGQGRGANVA